LFAERAARAAGVADLQHRQHKGERSRLQSRRAGLVGRPRKRFRGRRQEDRFLKASVASFERYGGRLLRSVDRATRPAGPDRMTELKTSPAGKMRPFSELRAL